MLRPVEVAASAAHTPEHERDPVELVILGALAVLSVWMVGLLVKRTLVNGEGWTGADGLHPSDQLQYMNWIRDAGRHVLISDLYELRPSAASFLHPGFLLSGALTALGVAPWLAYLVWKPAAVVGLFLAVRAYAHRIVPSRSGRRAALILALFFVPTAAFITSIAGQSPNFYLLGIEVEMWPGTWLWGYSFTVLAVAAIPAALLLYERDRGRRRIGAAAPLLGMLCSWFQPWQGATLLGTLVVTELLMVRLHRASRGRLEPGRGRSSQIPLLAINAAAATAPLAYYALLARFDPSWALAKRVNTFGAWPLWTLLASMAPLALPAALAYRLAPATFQEVAVRAWPLIALGVYWLIAYAHIGTFPIHSFQGMTIPLAILAVTGVGAHVRSWGPASRAVAVCVIGALIVPALVWKLNDARNSINVNAAVFPGAPPNVYFLPRSEADALRFVTDDPRPGGVLTPLYLGQLIPEATGRRTWVGALSWTPDFLLRVSRVERLFTGELTPVQAITFVRSTGARYLIIDCDHHGDLTTQLRPIIDGARQFGCARVLHVAGV